MAAASWKRESEAAPKPIEVVKVFLLNSLSPPEVAFTKTPSWRDVSHSTSASIVVVGTGALEVKLRHHEDALSSNEDENAMFEHMVSRRQGRLDGPRTSEGLLERLQDWTRMQQEEGSRWAAIFSPWLARFEEAISSARQGVDLSNVDVAPSDAICGQSAAGNPAVRFLQDLAASKQVSGLMASTISAGRDEYLKQCAVSVGWEPLLLLLLAVRCAAAQSASKETESAALPIFIKDAVPLVESLPSASSFISSRCSVTRADSPDLRAQAFLARLIQSEDGLECSSPQSPSTTARGSFVFETSMAQRHALARSGNFKSFRETGGTDGEDGGHDTIAGRVRLHFWDDFFAYRELGSVSKERVLGSAEGSLKTLGVVPGLTLKQEHTFSPSETSSSFFASLKRRPRSPLHSHRSSKGFLRRPPGSTAVPLPVSARRPAPPAESRARLPELTPRKSNTPAEGRTGQQPASPPQLTQAEAVKSPSKASDAKQLTGKDVRMVGRKAAVPLFMGAGKEVPSASPALPFISNRIGFVPPGGLQVTEATLDLSRDAGPETTFLDKTAIIELRCAYCRYHNIQADETISKTNRHARKLASLKRSGVFQFRVTKPQLCESCGDSVRAPMFRPDKATIVREVSKTILEEDSSDSQPLKAKAKLGLLAAKKDGTLERIANDMKSGKVDLSQELQADGGANVKTEEKSAELHRPSQHEETSMKTETMKTLHREASAASAFGSSGQLDTVAPGALPYFRACERFQARPMARAAAALASTTGVLQSHEVTRSGKRLSISGNEPLSLVFRSVGLDDRGLDALLETFVQAPNTAGGFGVVRIDLAGNLITDKGLEGLLERVEEPLQWSFRLDALDIAKNRHLTPYGLDPLLRLLMSEKLPRLRTLRIGGMELMDVFAQKFLGSVAASCAHGLQELDVSFCGIGRTGSAAPAALAGVAAQFFELRVLDASGNFLHSNWLSQLGWSLAEPCTVRSLHLAHNAGGNAAPQAQKKGGPMLAFFETLASLKELRLLDFRSAEVDSFSAFSLSQVLTWMPSLEALLISGNPIGSFGLRCLLRSTILGKDTMKDGERQSLAALVVDACSDDVKEMELPPVQLADPSGSYSLDLSECFSRSIIGFCLEKWASSKLPFEQAFISMTINGKSAGPFERRQDGRWSHPQSGKLAFTFLLPFSPAATRSHTISSVLKAGEAAREPRPQDRNREPLPRNLEERFLGFAAACNESITLSSAIRAVAADYFVSASFAATMLSWLRQLTHPTKAGPSDQMMKLTAQVLLDSVQSVGAVENSQDDQCLRMLDAMFVPEWTINTDAFLPECFPGAADHSLSHAKIAPGARAATMDFVVAGNATGRYVLNLEVPSDHLVAEYMLRINAWEVELGKALALPDISQAGNYQCIRNEELNRNSFTYSVDWLLPPSGCFSFHYVAARRPLRQQKALREVTWKKLLAVLEDAAVPPLVRILCLRRISPALTISCQQLAAALSLFAQESQQIRIALLAVLLFRVRDYGNLWDPSVGLFAAGGLCGSKDMRDLCEQAFGRLNVVDPVRIQGNQFLIKLAIYEDWQLLRMILDIAFTEGSRALVPEHFPVCAYGSYAHDLEVMKAPSEAWIKAGPPQYGVLSLCYSNEAGKLKFRKTMANKYCRWEV